MTGLERLLIALVIGAALVGGGYFWGDHAASNACEAGKSKDKDKVIEVTEKKKDAGRKVAQAYERKRAARTASFESIEKRGDINDEKNSAYRACGLDADGLRIWRDANAGIESDAGGGTDGAASEPAGPGVGDAARSGEESPPGGQNLPRAGGPLPVAVGLDH